MCCAAAALLMLGPRAAAILWWLFDTTRWNLVFSNALIPLLGVIFLPWTTLAYVLMWDPNGISLLGLILVALGFVVDVGSYAGGAYTNRDRMASIYR